MDPIVAGVRSEDRVSALDSGQLELGLNPANLDGISEVVIAMSPTTTGPLPDDKLTEEEQIAMKKLDSITPGEVVELDATERFLRQHNFTNEYIGELLTDTELNKKLIRKVDMILLPMLMGTYMLQYIDKNALSYAAVFDLFTDTGISSDQYSWFAKLGGLLTYGIGQIKNFPVWKAVFMTCGGMTVVWGFVLLFFLPDSIMSARHFTLEERALLIGRGRLARTGVLNKTIKWNQIREAFIDPQVWLLVLFMLLNETINGGIANFGKLIIKGVVKDPLETVALGIPMGAFQVMYILSGTFLASRIKDCRTIIMAVYLIPTMIGVCLLWKLDREHHKIGVLFGYYIIGAFVCSLVLAMQMPASNLGGYTKRITASAMVFIAYCVGNVIGPHAFLGSEAPLYPTGCITILSCSVAQMVVAIMLRVLLSRRNARRDAAAAAVGTNNEDASEVDGADLTDFENPHFRYVL
ncbi:allantoate permease [Fusarium napiforme]|uniref:Allantoate permease n=1 Tax=Fusarium napiforme TaxID=42672 RepID=A0A8H5JYH0_9HYPO|nr:allantoate permease [Fusarium napiforme]